MLKREIPYRERLEFCISRKNAPFMLVIKLGKTCCHLAASGSGSSDDNKRSACLDIIIFSITFVADDKRNIRWISGNKIMKIYRNMQLFKSVFEQEGTFLTGKLSDCNTSYI